MPRIRPGGAPPASRNQRRLERKPPGIWFWVTLFFRGKMPLGRVAHSGQNCRDHQLFAQLRADHQIVEMGGPPFLAKTPLDAARASRLDRADPSGGIRGVARAQADARHAVCEGRKEENMKDVRVAPQDALAAEIGRA